MSFYYWCLNFNEAKVTSNRASVGAPITLFVYDLDDQSLSCEINILVYKDTVLYIDPPQSLHWQEPFTLGHPFLRSHSQLCIQVLYLLEPFAMCFLVSSCRTNTMFCYFMLIKYIIWCHASGHWTSGAQIFWNEFILNYIIATYSKPQVTWVELLKYLWHFIISIWNSLY